MVSIFSLTSLVVVGLLIGLTNVQACEDKPVYIEKLSDGREFGIFMQISQVEKSPRWKDEGMPAMAWMAATKYLAKWADEKYTDYEDWKYYQVGIEGFECPELAQHRFYLFHLVVTKNGERTFGRQHFAAVLLDGTVFGPAEITGPPAR